MKSSSRSGATVRLIAVHSTEGIMRADQLREFFDRPTAAGSSHAGADETGALLGPAQGYVAYDRAAWTLRNGNAVSDNIELCAWARWTRAEWLSRPKLLEACARWVAERCKARGIPIVKLSPAEVRSGRAGVIGHVDWTQGMQEGSHWDPGPGFPWDVVIAAATGSPTTGGNPFMALTDDQQIRLLAAAEKGAWLADQMKPQIDRLPDEDAQTDLLMWAVTDPDEGLRTLVASLQGQVTELTAAVGALSERLEPPA